jgi:hypothetical protein
MSRLLGPSGTEAVVMTGIFSNVARFASAVVLAHNATTLISFTV